MATPSRFLAVLAALTLAAAATPARAGVPPRIDLDVQDAAIGNVLRLIATTAHLNLVASGAVKGRITLHLRNVPWRLALKVVARSQGFAVRQEGNVLRVDTPAAFAKEAAQAVRARDAARQLAPERVTVIPVSYARAAELAPKVQAVLGHRGKVLVDQRTNRLVLITGGR